MGWDEFDYCARHVDGGAFTLTMHPEVIGRGGRFAALERFVESLVQEGEVWFARLDAVAAHVAPQLARARA